MPPPPSYIDITSLPFEVTVPQADFNAGTYGGVTNECWFRFVAPGDFALGCLVDEDPAGTYRPRLDIALDNGTTFFGGVLDGKLGFWSWLSAGTFYLRLRRYPAGGTATGWDYTVQFSEGAFLSSTPPVGSILINDDSRVSSSATPDRPHETEDFPATVWTPTGTFLGFVAPIASGEIGDTTPDGYMLLHRLNRVSGPAFQLVGPDLQEITKFDTSPATGNSPLPLICNDGTSFYIVNPQTNAVHQVNRVTGASTLIATLDENFWCRAAGVSRDGSIMYWASGNDYAGIHRHDLIGDAPLSDLYTIPGFVTDKDAIATTGINNHPGEILVLPDTTIVTFWQKWDDGAGGGTYYLLHLQPDGTLINSFEVCDNLADDINSKWIDHIHYAGVDPTQSVHLWLFTSWGSKGIIGRYSLTTGSFISSFEVPLMSAGAPFGIADPDYTTPFAPSMSCTFLTTRYPVVSRVPMLLVR